MTNVSRVNISWFNFLMGTQKFLWDLFWGQQTENPVSTGYDLKNKKIKRNIRAKIVQTKKLPGCFSGNCKGKEDGMRNIITETVEYE